MEPEEIREDIPMAENTNIKSDVYLDIKTKDLLKQLSLKDSRCATATS